MMAECVQVDILAICPLLEGTKGMAVHTKSMGCTHTDKGRTATLSMLPGQV